MTEKLEQQQKMKESASPPHTMMFTQHSPPLSDGTKETTNAKQLDFQYEVSITNDDIDTIGHHDPPDDDNVRRERMDRTTPPLPLPGWYPQGGGDRRRDRGRRRGGSRRRRRGDRPDQQRRRRSSEGGGILRATARING